MVPELALELSIAVTRLRSWLYGEAVAASRRGSG